MLFSSLCLGWLSLQLAQSRKQARAVGKIQHLGGTVYYDFQHYYDKNGEGSLNEARPPDDWMLARKLFGNDPFSNVYHVQFVEQTLIPQVPGRTHYLGLKDMPTELSRDADNYISLLSALPELHTLDLSSSNVSDKSIPTLGELKTLKWLFLKETSMSPDGIKQLQEMLPECEVYWR
ncbi:MAG: hypothetical protein GXP24_13575 [Planctomycetes bacterium]|nr:hypothetical protein [Planctomycetota bacterium]